MFYRDLNFDSWYTGSLTGVGISRTKLTSCWGESESRFWSNSVYNRTPARTAAASTERRREFIVEIVYISLKTVSPVILTAPGSSQIMTTCNDSFSGTVLRGVLANVYIQQNNLGIHADENENFFRFFFDKLRFIQANVVVHGHRSSHLPLSLMKAKDSQNMPEILDLFKDNSKAGYKSLKGMAWVDSLTGTLYPAEVCSSVSFHMSRSSCSERIGGHSKDGKVFTYESIDKGQVFQGALVGDKKDLEDFLKQLPLQNHTLRCRLGRSRYTQYGQCELTFSNPEPIPTISVSKDVDLVLDTPLIPLSGNVSRAEDVLQCVADSMNTLTGTSDFFIGKVFGASQNVENFVGIWGMHRQQVQALSAGTAFELLKKTEWTKTDQNALQNVLYKGMGIRCEEGFGQIRIWQSDVKRVGRTELGEKEKSFVPIQSAESRKIVLYILKKYQSEQLKQQAYNDAKQMKVESVSSVTHMFARLESWLGDRRNISKSRERFHQ